jgi:hypothetical protein
MAPGGTSDVLLLVPSDGDGRSKRFLADSNEASGADRKEARRGGSGAQQSRRPAASSARQLLQGPHAHASCAGRSRQPAASIAWPDRR